MEMNRDMKCKLLTYEWACKEVFEKSLSSEKVLSLADTIIDIGMTLKEEEIKDFFTEIVYNTDRFFFKRIKKYGEKEQREKLSIIASKYLKYQALEDKAKRKAEELI